MEEKLHEIQKTPLMLENAPKEKPPKKKKGLLKPTTDPNILKKFFNFD